MPNVTWVTDKLIATFLSHSLFLNIFTDPAQPVHLNTQVLLLFIAQLKNTSKISKSTQLHEIIMMSVACINLNLLCWFSQTKGCGVVADVTIYEVEHFVNLNAVLAAGFPQT